MNASCSSVFFSLCIWPHPWSLAFLPGLTEKSLDTIRSWTKGNTFSHTLVQSRVPGDQIGPDKCARYSKEGILILVFVALFRERIEGFPLWTHMYGCERNKGCNRIRLKPAICWSLFPFPSLFKSSSKNCRISVHASSSSISSKLMEVERRSIPN